MAQWLRGLILSEDLGSIPRIQMAAHSCLQLTVLGDMPPLPGFSRHQIRTWHTDVHADKTPGHIKEIQFVKEWAATTSHHMVHFISFFLGTGSSLSLPGSNGQRTWPRFQAGLSGRRTATCSQAASPELLSEFGFHPRGSSELSHVQGRSWLGTDLSSSCLASALS